jgi:nucleoside-diphosphate-sugar epimerase
MVRRSSDLAAIRDLPVEWAYADMRDGDGLREACRDVDLVCHNAALTRAVDEETFFRVNTAGTETLARTCLEVNGRLGRFLYVSSQAAAGPAPGVDEPLDESSPARPVTWYGKSKLAAEEALKAMAALPLTIVRPSPVFGPWERDFFAYFQLIQRGLSLQLGRNERHLSLIYVGDLVDLILLALESPAAVGQTYFACAYPSSYAGLSKAIAEAMAKSPVTVTVPEFALVPLVWWSKVQGKLTGKPALINDQRVLDMKQPFWLCSSAKARHELGFAPRQSLQAAVEETAAWYRKNGWL